VSEPIRVLVIGCGKMGSSHARAYRAIDGFELVGLVAPSARRRASSIEKSLWATSYATIRRGYDS
jgi:predicted dehydrogenase